MILLFLQNHRYVQTQPFLIHVATFCLLWFFFLSRHNAAIMVWLGLSTKPFGEGSGKKISQFGLSYMFWSPQSCMEMIKRPSRNIQVYMEFTKLSVFFKGYLGTFPAVDIQIYVWVSSKVSRWQSAIWQPCWIIITLTLNSNIISWRLGWEITICFERRTVEKPLIFLLQLQSQKLPMFTTSVHRLLGIPCSVPVQPIQHVSLCEEAENPMKYKTAGVECFLWIHFYCTN